MNDEYRTPQYIFNWLQQNLPFELVLDLAATKQNTKCPNFFTKERDALFQDWSNTICKITNNKPEIYGAFCNPPYSKPNLPLFMSKAMYEAERGANLCFLVPLDQTEWSKLYVWDYAEVWIPDDRISFIDPALGVPEGRPPKGSMFALFGPATVKGFIKSVHIPKVGIGL